MHEPENTISKLNSDNAHLIGYSAAMGDVYIDHCSESTYASY
jgi:hypothetical protein